MTSHCAGTVQVREESESGIRKWEEMWFKTTAEDGETGAAVTCDGRLFHRRAAAKGNALSPTVDNRAPTLLGVAGWPPRQKYRGLESLGPYKVGIYGRKWCLIGSQTVIIIYSLVMSMQCSYKCLDCPRSSQDIVFQSTSLCSVWRPLCWEWSDLELDWSPDITQHTAYSYRVYFM